MKGAIGSRAAYKEACRRLGGRAVIWMQDDLCCVGTIWWTFLHCRGSGKTWALAFQNADKRAGRKQETTP
jgi:hypothetical protein